MKMNTVLFLAAAYMLTSSCQALSNVQTASSKSVSKIPALQDFDYQTNDRLPWLRDGYDTWEWQGHSINYLEMGGDDSSKPDKPALLLIHGFGASAYHFRYNIPVLARDYHVYAIDMLGFGLSDKPLVEYSAEIWCDQAADFIQQVIQKETTVAGNSLGGFTALYASTVDEVKPLIKGCVLLNAAGRFKDPTAPVVEDETPNAFIENIKAAVQRLVIGASFIYTKQPARIEQVLKQVYPVNSDIVDAELVESIQYPSFDPNAAEVFFRVIAKNGSGPQVYIDDLLERLDVPLLLCWGEEDPWIRSTAADKIQALYPEKSQRVSIDAGHCPHDEAAPEVNAAIKAFMENL
mmetsp:Transcript_19172/g.31818  ORF Transcript_19172/g.31818 Transcript_19172/m.31818 type:complete len:349 (-) Transcript_19172:66-1112(-)